LLRHHVSLDGRTMRLAVAELVTPLGLVRVAVREDRVCALAFDDGWARRARWLERRFGTVELTPVDEPAGVTSRLAAYFAGALDALDAIAVDTGGTAFQQRVWSALRRVPRGHTVAYRDLAATIGAPAAVRAVGAANGANPVGIVIPCHRVIGANGELTGYGGGLSRKRWLLDHERALAQREAFPGTQLAAR